MQGMTALAQEATDLNPRRVPVDVEIVVPVHNEAPQLADRIRTLRSFLDERQQAQCGVAPERLEAALGVAETAAQADLDQQVVRTRNQLPLRPAHHVRPVSYTHLTLPTN